MVKLKAATMLDDEVCETENQVRETDSQVATIEPEPEAIGDGEKEFKPIVGQISVPLPDECQTKVVLLFVNDRRQYADSAILPRWITGFKIERDYDTQPYERGCVEEPDENVTEEYWYEDLGEAIIAAADAAGFWLTCNSFEGDNCYHQADSALENWKLELDVEHCTASMFDEQEDEPEAVQAVTAVELVQAASEPAATTLAEPVTSQADSEREREKAAIAWAIAEANMELARAMAKTKKLKKLIDSSVAQLEEIEEQEADEAEQAEEDQAAATGERDREVIDVMLHGETSAEAAATAQPTEEPWREKKIVDLPGLTAKIVEILDCENIATIGDWVDWPAKHPGLEYTQIDTSAGKLTEKRYERVADTINAIVAGK